MFSAVSACCRLTPGFSLATNGSQWLFRCGAHFRRMQIRHQLFGHGERRPEFADQAALHSVKARGRHSNHGVVHAVQQDGVSQDAAVGAETAAPQAVAEHHHLARTGCAILIGRDAAAEFHGDARQRKIGAVGKLPPDTLRLARTADARRNQREVRRYAFEDRFGLIAEIDIVGPGEGRAVR